MPRPNAKTQRWIDLLAALLVRRFPATFAELARDVPAYAANASASAVMRMFERDKDELRAFGVPIETVIDPSGERAAYRLQHRDFYLPYLGIAAPGGGGRAPNRLDRFGYRALAQLAFEPDELDAVAAAGARVRALGNPLLAADAESAMRKLALDLPVRDDADDDVLLVSRGPQAAAATFEVLAEALHRRKTVRFDYYTISGDRTETRTVDPYGLFFLGSHWYLAARDHARGEMRTFRLSRISSPHLADSRAHTPDFDVPAEFDLREHAASRRAWELGEGEGVLAIVHFHRASGAARAASRLGSEVPGERRRRAFQVRRVHSFARWLLSFGGDAEPVAPPELVDAYRGLVDATLRAYGTSSGGAPERRT